MMGHATDVCKRQEDKSPVCMQAEQLKQKEAALAEKSAYVGKLEWRLLCQHKSLEEKHNKATARAAGRLPPPAKPQLPGAVHSPALDAGLVSCVRRRP